MTSVESGIVRRWLHHVSPSRRVMWSGIALIAAGAVGSGMAVWPHVQALQGQPVMLASLVAVSGLLLVLAALLHELWRQWTSRTALQASECALPEPPAGLGDMPERRGQAGPVLHDELTRLFNQATITERLEQVIEQARPVGGCALLYLDLDRFKQVHDARGHAVGDLLLIEVAQRLQGALRGADVVGRMGENAFAVVLPGVAAVEQARRSALRLAAVLREPYVLGGITSRIDASIGVALFPADGDTAAALLQQARGALERVKSTGRSAVACSESPAALADALLMEQDLQDALELEQFEMSYQPVFGVRSGAPLAFEALVGWRHPTRGMVPPSVFMPLCERSGLIEKLGRWVLLTACTEAATWATPVRLSVNLAAAQFRRGDLEHLVIETLEHSGLAPERLDLEVSEAVLLEHSQQVLAVMLPLRTLGVRLVLDDFGPAKVALHNFRDGAFQQIKINRYSVAAMLIDPDAMGVVRSVLDMAAEMQIDVVAEGVEEQVQLDMLTHLGCGQVQGGLLGAPQSPEWTRQYLWQATRRIDGGAVLLGAGG